MKYLIITRSGGNGHLHLVAIKKHEILKRDPNAEFMIKILRALGSESELQLHGIVPKKREIYHF